jgi:hypothetical protein
MSTAKEHATSLFVGAMYYWFMGDEATAHMLIGTAVQVQRMGVMVGDA